MHSSFTKSQQMFDFIFFNTIKFQAEPFDSRFKKTFEFLLFFQFSQTAQTYGILQLLSTEWKVLRNE